MPHVIEELSRIKIAVGPFVSSFAIFFIVFEEALILISNLIDPFALSISQPVDEITFVRGSILPNVMAIPVWFSMEVIAFVDISIGESLNSVTMFFESVKLT
jgi:hypothetical protein